MESTARNLKKRGSYRNLWWVKATLASLVGLMFATFVAIIIVILHALDFNFIKKIEQMGIDWGMELYAHDPPSPIDSFDYEYVFVDVDKEACKQFIDKKLDPECLTSKPVPTSLIVDFVRAASESGAKIVIIDVAPPEKLEQQDRDVLLHGLAKIAESSETWVIAPIYARPGDSVNGLVINGDTRFDIVSGHAQGKLRLASVATYAVHGTVRSYPVASCFVTSEGQRWVPTIPYLAALLANPKTVDVIDDRYYNDNALEKKIVAIDKKHDCSQLDITPEQFKNGVNPALNLIDPFAMNKAPSIIEFFYSIPGLSMFLDMQEREDVLWNHLPKYRYYEASNLLAPACIRHLVNGVINQECFATRKDLYENKIIVLGSGQAQAMDKVHTPVGPMSGSELILNATRAFLEFKPLEKPSPLTMIWDKLKGIMIAMGPIVAAWCLIFASGPATQWFRLKLLYKTRKSKLRLLRRYRWKILNTIRSLAVVIIFIAGLYTAYLLEVVYLWNQLKQGIAIDLLYPIIALGIQGYTVGARVILSTFQRFAEILIGFLLAGLTKLKYL